MQTLSTLKRRVMAAVAGTDRAIAVAVTAEELINAINEAIDDVRTEMPYDIAPDESITLANEDYEYSLVGLGFAYIVAITMEDEDGEYPVVNRVWDHMWRILPGPVLKFDERMFSPLAGRKLRIEGQAFQDNLSSDTDVCYISDVFVVNRAAAGLLGEKGRIRLQMAEDSRQRSPFAPYPASTIVRN